jgi:hypothetical protein
MPRCTVPRKLAWPMPAFRERFPTEPVDSPSSCSACCQAASALNRTLQPRSSVPFAKRWFAARKSSSSPPCNKARTRRTCHSCRHTTPPLTFGQHRIAICVRVRAVNRHFDGKNQRHGEGSDRQGDACRSCQCITGEYLFRVGPNERPCTCLPGPDRIERKLQLRKARTAQACALRKFKRHFKRHFESSRGLGSDAIGILSPSLRCRLSHHGCAGARAPV